MPEHISIDELADADSGLLDPGRSAVVEDHLAHCAGCRGQAAALGQVSARLGAEPDPVMPASVLARLEAALRRESGYRSAGVDTLPDRHLSEHVARRVKQTLGPFGADLPTRSTRRWLVPALAAAAAAALVGFGGYVLSASVGLNEPPAVAAAVNSRELAPQARALDRSRNLTPHRFSRAWQCARSVTDGRIVGIAATTVDGGPALLVYTSPEGSTMVTVVTGCASGAPSAGPSARLPR